MNTKVNEESGRKRLRKAKRVVVKIGTALLTGNTTGLDRKYLKALCGAVSVLRSQGREVAIVTSGAIGTGCGLLGYDKKPVELPERQACAAVGQVELMRHYADCFKKTVPPAPVGQLLLTRDTFGNRARYLNARHTLLALFKHGAVPVINENDTVSVDEIRFGDNDTLSALVAGVCEAQLLVILTDVPGLMDSDPRSNPDAKLVSQVPLITPEIEKSARPTGSFLGTGGMASKIQAAKIAMSSGIDLVLASGRDPSILPDILAGDNIGTHFEAETGHAAARKLWLAYAGKPRGSIIVDEGAKQALVRGKKSLLPPGITGTKGRFEQGDLVSIVCGDTEFARGLTNYSAAEIAGIKGKKTAEAVKSGLLHYQEVVHRDNLAVL